MGSAKEYEDNKARCKEWNTLMIAIENSKRRWKLTDLRFLIPAPSRLDPEQQECYVEDLLRLKQIHARV